MAKSKKIAGVSVNLEVPPSKEDLINSALRTKVYYRKKKEVALKEINQEIKASGLYRNIPKDIKQDKPKRDN